MDKKKIRKEKIQLRKQLDTQLVKLYSASICNKLESFLYGTTAFYCAKGNEVNVHSAQIYAKRIGYPKTMDDQTMVFHEVFDSTKWKQSAFGIWEPEDGCFIEPEEFDIILIPLVAFDEKGNRLGYGKGYYDRYLQYTCALRIGIAYEFQKVEQLPREDHDISLDIVITEETIYDFRK